MINILLGAPGGGKSYEAVVYHVLPALKSGRKVVTNLPLQKAGFDRIDPSLWELVELREKSLKEPVGGRSFRAFSQVEDYADEWRSAEGHGPLYVVDECHMAMPKMTTPVELEEWFSMHRHYNADVLLITQSAGKLNVNIADMVQTAYKVRKATILGNDGKYLRLVTDGVRGPIIDDQQREYKSQFFCLYKSHTKGKSVGEMAAGDVSSRYQKMTRMSWLVMGVGLLIVAATIGIKVFSDDKKPAPKPKQTVSRPVAAAPVVAAAQPAKPPPVAAPAPVVVPAKLEDVKPKEKALPDPFESRGLHLTGCMQKAKTGEEWCTFAVSQNGFVVFTVTTAELLAAGFKWQKLGDCMGAITWGSNTRAVICDSPQVSMGVAGAASVGIKNGT